MPSRRIEFAVCCYWGGTFVTVRLSVSRCVVTLSIGLLVVLFAVLPPSLLCLNTSSKQASFLKFTKPSRIYLDNRGTSSLAIEPLALANLSVVASNGVAFEFGDSNLLDRRRDLVQLNEMLDRLRRLFWTFAQCWQALLQQPGLNLLLEANLPHKGEDMLESAA